MTLDIQSYNKPLIARSSVYDGCQLLEEHLEEVLKWGEKFLFFLEEKDDRTLWEAGLFFHDIGKAEFSIQDSLYNNRRPPISHTHISVIFYYSWLQDHTKKDLYELLTNPEVKVIAFGILSHHSPPHRELENNIFSQLFNRSVIIAKEAFKILKNFGFIVKEETFRATYDNFIRGYKENIIEFQFKHNIRHELRKKIVYFYNGLVKSDWYSAIGESINSNRIKPDFVAELLDSSKSEVHAYIANADKFDENILLELPTGFGKTFLGLGYASKTGRQRIIYTLPVSTIIEDVYSTVKEKIDEGNIAWYTSKYLVFKSLQSYLEERDYIEAKYFERPLIITTLDQILLAFLGVNRYPLKEASLYDSCVILDEPQLYSPLMLFLFSKFIKDYKGDISFIIMTATLPEFLKNTLGDCAIEPFKYQKDKIFKNFNRVYFEIGNYLGLSIKIQENQTELIKEIEHLVRKGKRIIIIFNTVEKAQRFFKLLPTSLNKYIMHGRYIYRDRINKLKELKAFLQSAGVVVTTQVIEAGVNVSCDVMFRELAPFDSLVQSAGRVNRFFENKEACPVYIFGSEEDYLPYKKQMLEISKKLLCNHSKNDRIEPEFSFFQILCEYWEVVSNYLKAEEQRAEKLYSTAKEVSPFSLPLEEENIDLRNTYFKASVIPFIYFREVENLIERYKNLTKKQIWEKKKILAEIESYMVEVPYWGKVDEKFFKDYMSEYEGYGLISLKYDPTLGLLSEPEESPIFL